MPFKEMNRESTFEHIIEYGKLIKYAY